MLARPGATVELPLADAPAPVMAEADRARRGAGG
jgi:hypothetical protein